MLESISQRIEKTPFKNIYWFARHLLNTDQYGCLGKTKETKLLKLVAILETFINQEQLTDDEKVLVCKNAIEKEILSMVRNGTKVYNQANEFIDVLCSQIKTIEDVVIFCITMKYVVSPINNAMKLVPSDDKEFCNKTALNILDAFGEEKIDLLISTWDDLGVKGCLDSERTIVVEEFTKLVENIVSLENIHHSEFDDNLIMTAFVQEFERRLGQKRKHRGGNSLEDVVDFIFDYYKFPSSKKPEHFNQDLEIDKWFKCKDGWYIGISCKRTLRERWKQISQAERSVLSHFKIKELWHIITYDRDLSDDKVVRLGEQGQVFYLMEDSDTYKHCANHKGMKDYVRPLSLLVSDIRNNIKKK